jgi:hypothetical protein
MILVLQGPQKTVLCALPWLPVCIYLAIGTLKSVSCHLRRKPFLLESLLSCRRPLANYSLNYSLPEEAKVLFLGTRSLAYIDGDTLSIKFFYTEGRVKS